MTERTITECILAARDSLTAETWHKGAYFKAKGPILCMCAHGALQAQVNPECAKAVTSASEVTTAVAAASAAGAEAAAEAAEVAAAASAAGAAAAAEPSAAAAAVEVAAAVAVAAVVAVVVDGEAVEALAVAAAAAAVAAAMWAYSRRPTWVSNVSERYGSLDAHYVLGMVGLTADYNDSHSSTLEDIKGKLTEAANLSASFGLGPVPA